MHEIGRRPETANMELSTMGRNEYRGIKPEGGISLNSVVAYWKNIFSGEAEKKDFVFFWHEYKKNGCFSNWYMSDFECDGKKYCCVEQYVMAEKARLFGDYKVCDKIMQSNSPEEIKALGRSVRPFNAEKWDAVKQDVMLKGNWCKYSQNEELGKKLLETGNATLAEASPYDKVWGIGMKEKQAGEVGPDGWKGENLLGKCLEQVRERLREYN